MHPENSQHPGCPGDRIDEESGFNASAIVTTKTMDQRLSVVTIATDDLPAMKVFYEDIFGWQPLAGNNDIVFYKLNGFLLSLCKRKQLTDFIGIRPEGTGFRAVTFGYNVSTETEVLDLYDALKSKGVKILGTPQQPPFGGLFFYFQDIEGNILEIASNPYVLLDDHNNAIGHKPIDHL